jgi:ATP synthase protein I
MMDADNASAESAPQSTDSWENGAQDPDFKPLTHEQALLWRSAQPELSPWRVVVVQWLVGLTLAALGGLLMQKTAIAWSLLYGAAAAAFPTTLMAWGLTRSRLSRSMGGQVEAVFLNFVVWEGLKILLAVVLLWIAPRIVPDLNWLALVAGLVVVLKVYWFGFFIQTRR